ncbi:MAG: hypothetical protein KAX19_04110 [Candidatus Brocadiae bacterium]|nr:hypothetical protein [Candidatus Brocadiia bacterium]
MRRGALDFLIRGAQVHDGKRFLPDPVSVGICEHALLLFGSGEKAHAAEVTNAPGRILAPAFLDVHNHGDLHLLSRDGINLLSQGAGAVLVGNRGFNTWGPAARHPVYLDGKAAFEFESAEACMDALAGRPLPLNAASLAGLAVLLRTDGVGARLERALDAGCIGLSVGLNYRGQENVGERTLIEACYPLQMGHVEGEF